MLLRLEYYSSQEYYQPIHFAACNGHWAVCKLLARYGADLRAETSVSLATHEAIPGSHDSLSVNHRNIDV